MKTLLVLMCINLFTIQNEQLYMKIMKNTFLASVVVLGLGLVSCSKSDDTAAQKAEAARTALQSGTWKIETYSDDGKDETSNYMNLDFTFQSSGAVSVSGDSSSYQGTWRVDAEGYDDSKKEKEVELYLLFSSPAKLVELSDDWDIDSQTDTRIVLRDVSGSDGSVDLLIFQKN